MDDGSTLVSSEIFHYLTRVLYYRRSKVNPFWNQLVVGGFQSNQPYVNDFPSSIYLLNCSNFRFLGYIDLYGSSYEDNVTATGFGQHLAIPLMRNAWKEDLTREEAQAVLEDCMRVLYYRDGRTINKVSLSFIIASLMSPF